jgi:two-component system, NtrC family, sensor kinase
MVRLQLNRPWNLRQHFPKLFQRSLARKTLIQMSYRIAIVMAMSAGLSYFHSISVLESQVTQGLEGYIQERGDEESGRFELARDNLAALQERFKIGLKQPLSNSSEQFGQTFFPWNDGTRRNFPQNRSLSEFDSVLLASASIGRDQSGQAATITPELEQRIMTAYRLIANYGAAWTNRFTNLYYVSPENVNINYWPGYTPALTSPANLYHPKETYFYIGDPNHNRDRKLAWTGVYLDPAVNVWMVSASLPLYEEGRFLGVIGHDIPITELLSTITAKRRPGTTNMIVRADGYLIAHENYTKKIEAAKGQLAIEQTDDPHIQRILQLIKRYPEKLVINNPEDNEYIAVTKLEGPDWYFITIFPKALLAPQALSIAGFIMISGMIVLGITMLLLRFVLNREIAQPLKQLTQASNYLANGDFSLTLDSRRKDELGQLAHAFNRMSTHLQGSFSELETINAELEHRVSDRTQALQSALTELSQTQAQMVHSEKMSALGKTVAGVAHEINNPVNFIHGNLTHIRQYTQGLLKLSKLYQQHYPEPVKEIHDLLEDIEIDFIETDMTKVLNSMEMGTSRIREIVLSLRNFSRLDEAAIKSVDLHEGLESTLLILQHRLQEGTTSSKISILRNYGDLPHINCYAGQINQVLMNLIVNAIDAIANITDRTPEIQIKTELQDNHVHIMVADNGSGIPDDVKSKIFDPFFTTKDVGQGTGLGLSISYQIITEMHRGKLWCDSRVGEGTTFHMEIPIDLSEAAMIEAAVDG